MKKTKLLLIVIFLFTRIIYAQSDKLARDKIIFASLSYFQDSINTPKINIMLIDSTQYSQYPNFSFEPDLLKDLPDTSIIGDLLIGLTKTFRIKVLITKHNFFHRIALKSRKTISQSLTDSNNWNHFYKVYPKTSGYYTTTEPFVKGNYAIIYIENFCGNLCGSGYILYLMYRYDIKEWKVIYTKQTWVS